MQIIIDIPDEYYNQIMKSKDNIVIKNIAYACIESGVPLPKGHGRLIDVSEYFKKEFGDAREFLDKATTIIEADKEYEAEVITRGNCMICGKELDEGLFFCKKCEAKAKSEG